MPSAPAPLQWKMQCLDNMHPGPWLRLWHVMQSTEDPLSGEGYPARKKQCFKVSESGKSVDKYHFKLSMFSSPNL
jgi:hypothetical protein